MCGQLCRSIEVAIVKEFYANLYDPEDKSLKQVRMRGHLNKFDVDSLNTFLKTPVVIEKGESLPAYSRFANLRPVPQELAARLCILGRGFELNADGLPLTFESLSLAIKLAYIKRNCWNLDDPSVTFRGTLANAWRMMVKL